MCARVSAQRLDDREDVTRATTHSLFDQALPSKDSDCDSDDDPDEACAGDAMTVPRFGRPVLLVDSGELVATYDKLGALESLRAIPLNLTAADVVADMLMAKCISLEGVRTYVQRVAPAAESKSGAKAAESKSGATA